MKKRLVLGLTLLLIFGFALSQEPPKPKTTQQKSKTEQRGSEKPPLFIKTPSPTTQAERDYETYEKHQKPWNETALAYATIALSVITLALAVFTALLWFATYRLVREAKKTAEEELRAYVFIESASIAGIAIGQEPKIWLLIRNYGKTPGHKVVILVSYH